MKLRSRAWLSLVLLGGCSSGGGAVEQGFCGDQKVDEGEFCDAYDSEPGGCAYDCSSFCGNGTIEGPEACDDGNALNGDSCSSDCSSGCGNGKVEEDETCDDGNDTAGDGCYQCRRPGDVLWYGYDTCDGGLSRGNEDTMLVSCLRDPAHLFIRYGLDGTRTDGPPPPLDPNEAYNTPLFLAEQPSGDIFIVTRPVRNSTTANEQRVRVYRTQSDGTVSWSLDLTEFPNGPSEGPGALAVGGGRVAVGGSTIPRNTAGFESQPTLALLTEAGELSWKKTLTGRPYGYSTAVELAEDGTIFAAGIWVDTGERPQQTMAWISAFDEEGNELWARATTLGRAGSVSDLRLSGGELQIILDGVTQDELVPEPPRLTGTVEIISVDAASGEPIGTRVLTTQQTNGQQLAAVGAILPHGKFSEAESLDSYAYSLDAISGYSAAGEEVFNTLTPRGSVLSVQGSLAIGDLLCLNRQEKNSNFMSCHTTR